MPILIPHSSDFGKVLSVSQVQLSHVATIVSCFYLVILFWNNIYLLNVVDRYIKTWMKIYVLPTSVILTLIFEWYFLPQLFGYA